MQELTLINEIKKVESKMLALLDPVVAKKEISFAIQHVAGSQQLQKCTPVSLQTAVYNIANIGLSLNPAAKEAYLVPRYNSQSQSLEASFQPSYVGLIKLLTDAGTIRSIVANVVHSGDDFSIDAASGEVKHRLCLVKANKGEIIGAYALATLSDGSKQVKWMELDEINEIRDCSESWKNEKTRPYSPWLKHWGEMACKTVVRRLYKYLPRSGGAAQDRIDKLIELDDKQYQSSDKQVFYIEDLLRTANISEEVSRRIYQEFLSYSKEEAETCIEYLKANQMESENPAKQFETRLKR